MRLYKPMLVAAATFLMCSCSTPRQITYFNDLRPGESEITVTVPDEIRIQPKDELSILVNCQDQRLTNLFNLPVVSQQIGQEGSVGSSRGLTGYTVDSEGNIDFPVIGKIRVRGMTREEVAAFVKEKIESGNWAKNPIVTVHFMNLSVSVLGEVASPGRYNIDRDNFTLLDALGMAGDLTIYGKRDKVLVMRNENGVQRVYGVNLCSAEHLYSSPAYHLQQNDVVYVEPNGTKARQSTVNGNNVRSTSFWISLASFLTTIGVLIFK